MSIRHRHFNLATRQGRGVLTGDIITRIRVVSLATAHDRRSSFTAAAADAPPWAFFDAATGLPPSLAFDPQQSLLAAGRVMRPGELGCYASHYLLWQELIDSGEPQMMVLEDDVTCDWPFLTFLARQDFAAMNVHYMRLFAKIPSPYRLVASPFLDVWRHLVQFLDLALGTQGYLITRAGATRLLEHCRQVLRPIDWEMDRTWDHGLANLCIFPFPLYERFVPSDIGETRFDATSMDRPTKLMRLRVQVTEKARRVYFGINAPRTLVRTDHLR